MSFKVVEAGACPPVVWAKPDGIRGQPFEDPTGWERKPEDYGGAATGGVGGRPAGLDTGGASGPAALHG